MPDTLSLPAFFSSNMVLQRNTPIKIWGKARPGAKVEVVLTHNRVETIADADGNWGVSLPDVRTGGPYELDVSSEGEIKRFTNVLVGDVWVCSGQSNMEWTISSLRPENRPQNLKSLPMIRMFTVDKAQAVRPQWDATGTWQAVNAESIQSFSAVGFYFGKKLHETLNVPIGLICSAWGGTQAEAWTPRSALAGDASLARHLEGVPDEQALTWHQTQPHEDPGNTGHAAGWARATADLSEWNTMRLPQFWEHVGLDMDGSVWFRRSVDLPPAWVGKPLTLSLGAIDDFDTTYFNGHEIGGIGLETPNWWAHPRVYTVPVDFSRVGPNMIAVRVFDRWGNGGFAGPAAAMHIGPADESSPPISLVGDWLYRVEQALPSVKLDQAVSNTSLYNGMIHPLVGMPIAGAIWYQGESNVGRAWEYTRLLRTMIRSWRAAWGQGDFPFLIVQLADFNQNDDTSNSPWSELRHAQQIVSESEPNCGLAAASDLGDPTDIHPQNKRDVGLRLADEAMRVAYGHADAPRAPRLAGHRVEGSEVVIDFNFAEGGLVADGPVRELKIAGDDGIYHDATARIEGSSLRVSHPNVTRPASVRYAWRGYANGNLRGANGLPVLAFRTDEKPWVTQYAT
jgi:sialate O-acetylesterase